MPVYTIQSPWGRLYKIEGPEGATQDDIEAALMQTSPRFGAEMTMHQQNTPGALLPTQALGGLKPNYDTGAAVTPEQQAKIDKAGLGSRLLANFGAGANRMLEGAKNLVEGTAFTGGDKTPLEAARQANQEAALSKSTTGGKALQVGGELAATAPTMLVGMGAGAVPAGANLLSRVLALGSAGKVVMPVLGMATQGAVTGALQPVQNMPYSKDQSPYIPSQWLKNVGAGAIAAPLVGAAGKTLGAGWNEASIMSQSGARKAVATELSQKIAQDGGDPVLLADQLRNAPPTLSGADATAGHLTMNPTLLGFEHGSRLDKRTRTGWDQFETRTGVGRANFLDTVTGVNPDPRAAAAAIGTKSAPFQQAAILEADKQSANMAQGIGPQIKQGLQGVKFNQMDKQSSKAMQLINDKLNSGQVITAADAVEMRSWLRSVENPDPGIRDAMDVIDSTLASRTKVLGQKDNLWDQYLQKAHQLGETSNEERALFNIRNSHVVSQTGTPIGAPVPGAPTVAAVNPNTLANALKSNIEDPMFGTRNLDPATEQDIHGLVNETNASTQWQHASPQTLEPAMPATGKFINTLEHTPLAPAVDALSAGAKAIGANDKRPQVLASLLRDPSAMGEALMGATRTALSSPDTSMTTYLSSLLRQGGALGASSMVPPQQYPFNINAQPSGGTNAP